MAPIFAVLASISLVTWENGMRTLSGVRFTFSVRMAWQLSAASISAGVAAGRAAQRSRWSMRYRMMRRRAAPALAFNLGFSYSARAGMEKRASRIEILLIATLDALIAFGLGRSLTESILRLLIATLKD